MKNICGIDPSINSTALTILDLDDNKDKIIDYLFFGNIKKYSCFDNYRFLDFDSSKSYSEFIEKNNFVISNILKFLNKNNVEYIAIENYSYCSLTQTAYQIGEFVGCLKRELYNNGFKIRLYEPTVIKMFFTGKGNALKTQISDIIEKYYINEINVDFSKYDKYKYDLYDSFCTVKLLKTELLLKENRINQINDIFKKVFFKKHKKDKKTLFEKDFTYKKKPRLFNSEVF